MTAFHYKENPHPPVAGVGHFGRIIMLIHGDCIEEMVKLNSGTVDLILCDLPFNLTAPEWDRQISFEKLWQQYNRLIKKDGVIALFATQPFTTRLINSNEKKFRYCWYWIKNQGTNFFHAKRMPIRKVEEICIFGGKRYYPQVTDGHVPTNSAKGKSDGKAYFGINRRNEEGGKTTRFPTNILEFKCVDNYSRLHSAEKPVDLCEYLIKTYTLEGEVVLDNCMGSGTTGVAAKNTNRKFIGIEKDEKYFKIAVNRINPISLPPLM